MASPLYVNLWLATHVGKVAPVACVSTGAGLAIAKRLDREGAAFLVTYLA